MSKMESSGIFLAVILNCFLCRDCLAAERLKWSDCSDGDSPVQVTFMDVQPVPVQLPGSVWYSINSSLARSVGSSTLDVQIWKKLYFFDMYIGEIKIPCIVNVGSCTFPELCNLVEDMITHNWLSVMSDMGHQLKRMIMSYGIDPTVCPMSATNLTINNYELRLPSVPSILTWFAAGNYRAKIKITENGSDEVMVCIDAELAVKKRGCSNFLCL